MNDLQISPGPWTADDANGEGPYGVFDSNGDPICMLLDGKNPLPLCFSHEVHEANAFMLAAAFKMYHALKALRECINDDGTRRLDPKASQFKPVDEASDAVSILQEVDDAISEAEGRTIQAQRKRLGTQSFKL